jgi:hypothetical protein
MTSFSYMVLILSAMLLLRILKSTTGSCGDRLSISGTFFKVKRTFEDVYGEGHDVEYTGPLGRTTPFERNVYVHDCVFIDCSSESSGGALCCEMVSNLLVEQSSFISCRTSSYEGGGIFYDGFNGGACVLSKICGFDCTTTYSGDGYSDGMFAYIQIEQRGSKLNHVNDSTITHTSIQSVKESWGALVLIEGKILCPSVNITNNECYKYPALCIRIIGTDTSCISYNSIVNNSANGGFGCIEFSVYPYCIIDTCNVLNNKQTDTSGHGTIYMQRGNLNIKDSCILGNNKGGKVFYQDGSSGEITISNCTIDDDIFSETRYYGTVKIVKTLEITFINALTHIVTQSCDSYFDSYGTLTVKPVPTPDITPVETPDRTPVETTETNETNKINEANETNELSGISSGVVAAIVIACIVVVAAVIFSIYWFLFRNKEKDENIEI